MRNKQPRAARVHFRTDVRALIDGKYFGLIRDVSLLGCSLDTDEWLPVDKQPHVLRIQLPRGKGIVLKGTIQRSQVHPSPKAGSQYEIGFKFDANCEEYDAYRTWLKTMTASAKTGTANVFQSDDKVLVSRLLEQIDRMPIE